MLNVEQHSVLLMHRTGETADKVHAEAHGHVSPSCAVISVEPTISVNMIARKAESWIGIVFAEGGSWMRPRKASTADRSTAITSLATYSRRHLHRRTKKIAAFLDGFAGMYTDPYTDRGLADFVIRCEFLLNLNCTRDRSRCIDKRRHNAVAQVFYLGAAMVFQTPPDDRVVSPEQFHRHRIAELRRHLGRTDHVREHDGAEG